MSCNLGKTRTRFTVNSIVFVILFWFLVENFKLSARTKDARDTRDAFLESVYPCITVPKDKYETFSANCLKCQPLSNKELLFLILQIRRS